MDQKAVDSVISQNIIICVISYGYIPFLTQQEGYLLCDTAGIKKRVFLHKAPYIFTIPQEGHCILNFY